MQRSHAPDSSDYAEAIATLVTAMPVERAAEVYDFAVFLRAKAGPTMPHELDDDDDWLADSEDQMRAEDALWETVYNRRQDELKALNEAARAEISEGSTEPMFDDHGDLALK